ncbi:MAG TPA: GGDEF domain-containing protein, partial [Solirubrobacteraceae bacterium]|nr:GGDEF domain-containing protein [Solirubrobacteraceae bacterium]
AGDVLLVDVASRLGDALRGGDTAARLGGDEFVVLAEDISGTAEAGLIARRLLRKLGVSASMGVAVATDARIDPQALVRTADAAMYVAKRRGGGTVEVADASAGEAEDEGEPPLPRLHRPRAIPGA